jgi:hypothetical protein
VLAGGWHCVQHKAELVVQEVRHGKAFDQGVVQVCWLAFCLTDKGWGVREERVGREREEGQY